MVSVAWLEKLLWFSRLAAKSRIVPLFSSVPLLLNPATSSARLPWLSILPALSNSVPLSAMLPRLSTVAPASTAIVR